MNRKQITIRIVALALVMFVITGVLSLRLVYLQLVKGEEYITSAQSQTSVRYNIKASRGEIFDRDGARMVSNVLSYTVQFNYYEWEREIQNDVILQVCDVLEKSGVSHYDTLPMTGQYPLVYTCEDFESGDGKALKKYVEKTFKTEEMPSAAELFTMLCEEYGISSSLELAEKRLIMGVRYEMKLREFGAYAPFTLATGLDIDTAAHITQLYQSLPGVSIEADSSRRYETDAAAHILGYVGPIWAEEYAELKTQGYGLNDILGKAGLEKALETHLHGIDGKETLVTDITGEVVERYVSTPPQPGDNCFLTIDLDLQEVAEQALAETIEGIRKKGAASRTGAGADAEGGAVVAIDVNTGEILAMASYPTYNLASFNADYDILKTDPLTPMYNRAIQGLYPPGSTFKMVTSAAALEEGIITPSTIINDLSRVVLSVSSWITLITVLPI